MNQRTIWIPSCWCVALSVRQYTQPSFYLATVSFTSCRLVCRNDVANSADRHTTATKCKLLVHKFISKCFIQPTSHLCWQLRLSLTVSLSKANQTSRRTRALCTRSCRAKDTDKRDILYKTRYTVRGSSFLNPGAKWRWVIRFKLQPV